MAAENPTFHTPDAFERSVRDHDFSFGLAVPEFEAALILAQAKSSPGMLKGELVKRVMGRLGRPLSEERIFLRYVDCLVNLKQLVRHDFTFHVTPSGSMRLRQIREGLQGAMNLINTTNY